MAGFIDSAVQDIDNRLRELKDEEKKLESARALLTGSRRGPGRPARRSSTEGQRRAPRTRGRRGGNTRSNQALELVRTRPGITIPQIAEELKIEPNYLYRVMPKLTADNVIRREGAGWFPVTDGESN